MQNWVSSAEKVLKVKKETCWDAGNEQESLTMCHFENNESFFLV